MPIKSAGKNFIPYEFHVSAQSRIVRATLLEEEIRNFFRYIRRFKKLESSDKKYNSEKKSVATPSTYT